MKYLNFILAFQLFVSPLAFAQDSGTSEPKTDKKGRPAVQAFDVAPMVGVTPGSIVTSLFQNTNFTSLQTIDNRKRPVSQWEITAEAAGNMIGVNSLKNGLNSDEVCNQFVEAMGIGLEGSEFPTPEEVDEMSAFADDHAMKSEPGEPSVYLMRLFTSSLKRYANEYCTASITFRDCSKKKIDKLLKIDEINAKEIYREKN